MRARILLGMLAAAILLAIPPAAVPATGPVGIWDPNVLEFGNVGPDVPLDARFWNVGDANVHLTQQDYPGFFDFRTAGGEGPPFCNLNTPIPPGGSCIVRFTRVTAGGNSSYTLHYNGTTSVLQLLTTAPLYPNISPGSHNFASVAVGGTSAPFTVTLHNPSLFFPKLVSLLETEKPGFRRSGGTCSVFVFALLGSCTVEYVFAPTMSGPQIGYFRIGQAGSYRVIVVTGTAFQPVAAIAPTSHDFGMIAQGARPSVTLTVSNTGDGPFTITSFGTAGGITFGRTGGTCALGGVVAAGSGCTVVVSVLIDNDADQTFSVGTDYGGTVSTQLSVRFAAPSFIAGAVGGGDYGDVELGSSATKTIRILNSGNVPLTPGAPPASGEFTGTSTCGTIAPGDECTYVYSFRPVGTRGPRNVSLVFSAFVPALGTTITRAPLTLTGNGVDNTPPSIAPPADVNASAGPSCQATVTPTPPTATDNSGTVASLVRSPTGTTFGLGTTNVTWTATDPFGNSSTAVQHVIVSDTTPPSVTAPANASVELGNSTAPAATGIATATDNCPGAIAITSTDTIGPGGPGIARVITRRWRAQDGAGNAGFANQTITVTDTVAPSISVPGTVIVDTGPGDTDGKVLVSDAQLGTASATDLNDVLIVSRSGVPAGNLFPVGTHVVTYTATDGAGNSASDQQAVIVNDTTPPVIGTPEPIAIAADGDCEANLSLDPPTATDNVGVVSLGHDWAGDAFPLGSTIVTWSAADEAGNTSSAEQTVSVADTSDPVLTLPANMTVEDGEDTSPAATGSATAGDNCPGLTIAYGDVVAPGGGSIARIIARTWTATDGSGNSASGTQTITVTDSTPPALTVPADVTVELGDDTSPAATGTATATDAGGPPTISYSDVVTPGFPIVIARTWTATDAAGNSASATQTITVVDTTAPALTLPANATVELGADTSPAATGTATATDASGPPTISHVDVVTPGVPTVIARAWTATDSSGNAASGTQTITVVDTTAPTLTVPADTTVELGGDTSPAATGQATATDAGGPPTITFADVVTPGMPTTIARTWTATDSSGNSASATQTITVVDTTAPALTVPADATVELGGDTSPAATGTATATDASGPPAISYSDFAAGNTIVRTWTATDSFGNAASGTQTITIVDTTDPVLSVPPPVTAFTGPGDSTGAALVPDLGTATATDLNGPVTIERTGVPAGNVFPIGETTVTYTATDAAGNTSTGTQIVTVVDDTPPVVSVGTVTVQAATMAGAPAVYPVDTSDNSGGAVTLDCSHEQGSTFPVGTTEVSCTGTDPSGNSTTDTGTVVVEEPAPLARIADLSGKCWALGLAPRGIKISLCGTLDLAAIWLARGRTALSCVALKVFLLELNALRGKKVTEAQYAVLIEARAIRNRMCG